MDGLAGMAADLSAKMTPEPAACAAQHDPLNGFHQACPGSSGRFNKVSEVIRAGLRLLEEQQQHFATRTLELKAALAEGMQSGEPQATDEVFDEIEAQVRELANSRR